MTSVSQTFWRTLLDNEVQSSDDAIKTLKLPASNYIHSLLVKASVTNGATSAKNQSIYDAIDKIEVIANGSDVIYSLTPLEIKRWHLWERGINIPQVRNERASAVQQATFPVMFGRDLFDPFYYVPAARLSDLELKVTYSPTIAATSFATGTVTFSVLALMSMGNPPEQYQGTLAHKTVKSFTSAASGDEQTLLPRGNMLRQIGVSAYESAVEPGANITRVKFHVNNQERVLVDATFNDLQEANKTERWVEHIESIHAATIDNDTINTYVSRIASSNINPQTTALLASNIQYFTKIDAVAGDQVTIDQNTGDFTAGAEDLLTDATLRNNDLIVRGFGVSHAAFINLAYQGETNLLNTSEYDELRLDLTQGNAGAAVRISTQEVRAL